MAFNASEFHFLYQPKPCSLRVYLRARGAKPEPPDVYHKLLEKLGQRHEQHHLSTLGEYFHAGASEELTRTAVGAGAAVIYQPAMRVVHSAYGEVRGVPDLFIREGDSYVIRDCKLSRRFAEEHHPEIFRQLQLYGWLYEQVFSTPPLRLEAFMGDCRLRTVNHEPEVALETLEFILSVERNHEEPIDPIGWSKCLDCGFHTQCWSRAQERHDVALLPSVDQALARALYGQGTTTYDDLAKRYSEDTLAVVRKRMGAREVKVGKAAGRILREAAAYCTGEIIRLEPPEVRKASNLVMFDVEGIPPHLEHAEKTYLWGLKVFGERPGPYLGALADIGAAGDEAGWRRFLANVQMVFAEYGNVWCVHWSPYEQTQVKKYVERYGDGDGIAARLVENLYDLHPVAQRALVIPVPSYSLKLIEQVAGYERRMPETGGKWSMATYIEAVETEDRERASALIESIVRYNEEDLDAMWGVYCWLLQMEQG